MPGCWFRGRSPRSACGQGGDVQPVDQRRVQRVVRLDTGRLQNRIDQRGIVARDDAQRIARLIDDARTFQRYGDMVGVGGGAAAGQPHMFGDLGLERTGTGRGVGAGTGEIDMDDGGAGGVVADLGIELFQRGIDPAAGRGFEVEVAFDPVDDAGTAQGSQTLVDLAADLAELRVGVIAQCEDGEPGLFEPRGIIGHQRLIEIDRPLGRVALTPGGGDDHEVFRFGHLRRA